MKAPYNLKFNILSLILVIGSSLNTLQSQQETFWSKVSFGGNVAIGFSSGSFSGVVEPRAVYNFNDKFATGFGINFGYTDADNFTATNYGVSVLSFYNPINEIQLSTEFQQMGVSRTIEIPGEEKLKDDYWYPALFVGAGYRMGNVSVGLRYDVLYDEDKSIYATAYIPFFTVFF